MDRLAAGAERYSGSGEWQVGAVISDVYEVREVIRSGGLGLVYRVRHRGWNLELAVKTPRPELLDSEEHVRSFETEAEAWVGLGLHPNTVSCSYVRRLAGVPRVFAEWVDGGSLADTVRTGRLYRGERSPARLLDIAIQFAWGLEHAHRHGLIHQDVKPANVMLASDGTVKVTDFGLAKARAAAGERPPAHPAATMIAGFGGMTPAYCSPEQAAAAADRTGVLTRATDVWSWAISVWEMFAGATPCAFGQTAAQVFESYLADGPPRRPGVPAMPPALVDLLRRCLTADPGGRPRRMAELAEELIGIYATVTGTAYPRTQPDPAELRADGLSNQALSLLDLGHVERAERSWQQALAADPLHTHAVFNYGLHRWRTGQHTDAHFLLQLASLHDQRPGAASARLIGSVYLERGDIDLARRWLDEASRLAAAASARDTDLDTARAGLTGRTPAREPIALEGHTKGICRVALSADGRIGASGSYDRTVRVWDLTSGRCLHTLPSQGPVTHDGHGPDPLVVSADGSRVLAIFDGALQVWDITTGRLRHCFEGFGPKGAGLAVSADGAVAVSAQNGTVQAWDLVAGRLLRTLRGSSGFRPQSSAVAVSADGQLAMAHDSAENLAQVWEIATGRLLHERADCYATVRDGAGRWALIRITPYTGGSAEVEHVLWQLDSGRDVPHAKLPALFRTAGHLSDDAAVAVCTGEVQGREVLRLWELRSGRCRRTVEAHGRNRHALIASNSDCSVIMGHSGTVPTVHVWQLEPAGPLAPWSYCRPADATELTTRADTVTEALSDIDRALSQRRWATAAQLIRDARAVPGFARDRELLGRWWSAAPAGERAGLNGVWEAKHIDREYGHDAAIGLSRNGIAAVGGRRQLVLLDLATGVTLHTLEAHPGFIWRVCCTADGRYAVTADEDTVRIWDVASGRCLHVLEVDGHRALSSIPTSDGDIILAVGSDGARVLDVATGSGTPLIADDARGIGSEVALDGARRIAATGGLFCGLRFWDVATGRCLATVAPEPPADDPTAVTVAGRWAFAAYSDCSIRMWDMTTGRYTRRFDGHTERVTALAADADGTMLVSASWDRTLRIWDRNSPDPRLVLIGHTHWVSHLALSADGRFAASGSRDDVLKIWDLRSGACLRTLTGHTSGISYLDLTDDGRFLVAGDFGHHVRVWELDWDYIFPDDPDGPRRPPSGRGEGQEAAGTSPAVGVERKRPPRFRRWLGRR
ncbi:WD40 repeat domain-containing serine/threonine protein kinase [Nocardia wallacei]|uniref:WD40 repeat domain-containing serine/threonine protein kinase n=2 Tax=Bacteria TaxID=2 RepID=UPI0024584F5F|nr:protein kinase [Nocardia wallacei]